MTIYTSIRFGTSNLVLLLHLEKEEEQTIKEVLYYIIVVWNAIKTPPFKPITM
mgnify:CR=1 FL=1